MRSPWRCAAFTPWPMGIEPTSNPCTARAPSTATTRSQPPSSRVPGPAGCYSAALWLRAAFADLHYDVHHGIADDNLVAVNSTMHGRHVAPWAVYTDDGAVDTVFPPTNKTFATTQSHWFRIEDGMIIEHWGNRDDLGMAKELGWVPPTPAYLFKMARAKRALRRGK